MPLSPHLSLGTKSLSELMPMHIALNAEGKITSIGRTLAKLMRGGDPLGQPFYQLFTIRRPAAVSRLADLQARTGQRLQIGLQGRPDLFRGVASATVEGGLVLNLSFGIHLIEAVRHNALTDADFAPTELAMEMLYLVEVKTAVMQELRRLNLRLQTEKGVAEEQALTDTLTGLRNLRALKLRMPQLLAQGVDFGLMHIDLDFFKQVNDTLGHAAGDQVLRHVAKALTIETRISDLVARVGGDEFIVLLPEISQAEKLAKIAERIIQRISRPIAFEGKLCRVSASIGLTLSASYLDPDANCMLADADAALYASKNAGRARAWFPAGPADKLPA
jgi:diguanylate cyclase (GGDEF)-like protein